MNNRKANRKMQERQANVFCLVMTSVFIVHWVLFWVVGNINSIRMAFTHYNPVSDKHVFYSSFSELFTNFADFVKDVFSMNTGKSILNGFYFQAAAI